MSENLQIKKGTGLVLIWQDGGREGRGAGVADFGGQVVVLLFGVFRIKKDLDI